MLTNIHPATSTEDAISQLDSHIPLVHSERKLIVESLYDLAFREGARQGRLAGIEAAQNHLRTVAAATPYPQVKDLLLEIAASYDSPHAEYKDPTTAIREKLADAKRMQGRKIA